jgi:3'-5' exoribonuclease
MMFQPAIALYGCDTDISRSRILLAMVPAEKPKTQFVKDLKDGDEVDSLFSVKFRKPPRQYAKGLMFEARLADRTGEISAKYWGGNKEAEVRKAYEAFDSDQVVRVKGSASSYRDVLEISVRPDMGGSIVRVPQGAYDLGDFVERSDHDLDQLMGDLNRHIGKIKNQHLRQLLAFFFADEGFVNRFKVAPASMQLHCNWVGGLAEHTLNVVEICDFLAKRYPKLDHDLLVTGALLHDIGKLDEYEVSTNIDVSVDGMLLGHIVIGAEMVSKACDSVPQMPKNLRLKVVHLILASHGELEYGAVKRPQFPEAVALHIADNADAKLEQYITAKEEARTEDPWIYDKRLGHIFLH